MPIREETTARRVIDADGHLREIDEEIIEYMPEGYRTQKKARQRSTA